MAGGSVAFQSCHPKAPEKEQLQRSSRLKELLREYFERDGAESDGNEEEEEEEEAKNLGMTPVSEIIPGFGLRRSKKG